MQSEKSSQREKILVDFSAEKSLRPRRSLRFIPFFLYFKLHTDFFEPEHEEYQRFASAMGNRTWTWGSYPDPASLLCAEINVTCRGGMTCVANVFLADRIGRPDGWTRLGKTVTICRRFVWAIRPR